MISDLAQKKKKQWGERDVLSNSAVTHDDTFDSLHYLLKLRGGNGARGGKREKGKQDGTGLRASKNKYCFFFVVFVDFSGKYVSSSGGGSLFQNFLNSHLQLYFFMETLIHLEIVG